MIKEITRQEALAILADDQKVYYLNPESLRLTDLSKIFSGKLLAEVADDDKPKELKKTKTVRKTIDTGKVKALNDAGWSAAKIADEMGVTPATIYNHLKKMT